MSLVVSAGEKSGTVQSTRLYTKPDPNARGGLRGELLVPQKTPLAVLAVPIDDYKKVYQAELIGDTHAFRFSGLPVGKYDLMCLYEDGFYEGFTLSREADTLSAVDRDSIKAAIGRAVQFFDTKEIHRSQGTPGADGGARCVLQELRTRRTITQMAEELAGYQIRSIKLVLLKDVGTAGWQMVETRELVRTEVAPGDRKGILAHRYDPQLSGIRVVDSVKDLGQLKLNTTESH